VGVDEGARCSCLTGSCGVCVPVCPLNA
jgi:hypothetical protein